MLTHFGVPKNVFSHLKASRVGSEYSPLYQKNTGFAKTPRPRREFKALSVCRNGRHGSLTFVSIFYSRCWESCNTTIHHIYHIYKPTVFRRPSPQKFFPHCFTRFFSFPNRWSDQTPLATGTRSCHLSAQWQLQARPLHWMGPEAHQGSVSRWKLEKYLKQGKQKRAQGPVVENRGFALSTTLFEWDVWVKQPFAQ